MRSTTFIVVLSLSVMCPLLTDAAPPTPPHGKHWFLVWGDDFNGSTLDTSKWGMRSEGFRAPRVHGGMTVRWRYEHDNVSVEDGKLVLRNTLGSYFLRAAAVASKGKFERTYGYYEASVRIAPTADGVHTAFWLQNDNRNRTASNGGLDGAADGAEIDILESVYTSGHYTYAVHWDRVRTLTSRPELPSIHDGRFHVFAVDWTPSGYRFYADGAFQSEFTDGVSHSDGYVILSTGLSWGAGDVTSGRFPNRALVDWVRVWELRDDPQHNSPAQGGPRIAATSLVGETLVVSTADIRDEDGLTNPRYSFQWLVDDGDGDADVEIANATGASYTTAPADAGKRVKVRVTFVDDGGTSETLISDASAVSGEVAIRAASAFVEEGADAVFEVTGGCNSAVPLAVEESGSMVRGPVPATVVHRDRTSATEIRIPTSDDSIHEPDSAVTVRLRPSSGCRPVGEGMATVTVLDQEPLARRPLWAADMTVTAFGAGDTGANTDAGFANVQTTENIRVKWLWHSRSQRVVYLSLREDLPGSGDGLLLLDDLALPLSEPYTDGGYRWDGVDLDWTHGQTVRVRLLRTVDTPDSTDLSLAALQSLAVSGLELTPAFDAAVPMYAAAADSGTTTITVSATPSDNRATATVAPADAAADAPGHQVALDYGETLVTVTVARHAGNRSAQRRYRVVVTRPEPTAAADENALPIVVSEPELLARENSTAVATLTAVDADTPAAELTWSIAGGADAAAFTLGATGALSFQQAKDYEAPDDADADGSYQVTVRVSDGTNTVDAALTVTLADADEVAPVLTRAAVNEATLALTWNEALDGQSTPAPDAFAVSVGTASAQTTAVAVERDLVKLTLSAAVTEDDTVAVSYHVPTGADSTALRDLAGNAAAGFSNLPVTNETVDPVAAPVVTEAAPRVTAVAIRQPATGAWHHVTGDTIQVEVRFNEAVTVTGTPQVTLDLDSGSRTASYAAQASEAAVLVFSYAVTDADRDDDGFGIGADALALNGGAIHRSGDAGVNAVLTHAGATAPARWVNPSRFTAVIESMPATHTGSGKYHVTLLFSDDLGTWRHLAQGVSVSGGALTRHHRPQAGDSQRWILDLVPAGNEDLVFTLPAASAGCETDAEICSLQDQPLAETVTGRIRGPAMPDTSLSALAVSGVALAPAFGAETTDYTASAAHAVAQVTVTATAAASGATVTYEPGQDADSETAGHQVDLGAGATGITVTVTAADEVTTRAYRVTVTRAPARPANLAAAANGNAVTLSWDPPAAGTVTRHEYRYRTTEDSEFPADWTAVPMSGAGQANAGGYSVAGLTTGYTYVFQVRAASGAVAGDPATAEPAVPLTVNPTAFTAVFESMPAIHTGSGSYEVVLLFSADLGTWRHLAQGVAVSGGTLTAHRRARQAAHRRWILNVRPSGDDDLVITLPAASDCATDAQICSIDDRPLADALVGRIAGPVAPHVPYVTGVALGDPPTGAAYYATGDTIRVEVQFNEAVEVTGTPRVALDLDSGRRPASHAASDSEAAKLVFTYVVTDADQDDDGLDIEAGELELNGGAIARRGEAAVRARLTHAGATTTRRVNPEPFTAVFESIPEQHTGTEKYEVTLLFSDDLGTYRHLEQGVTVSGGTLTRHRRAQPGKHRRWILEVQPSGDADLVITLPAPAECVTDADICTVDDRPLTEPLVGRIRWSAQGPAREPEISIATAASPVTEGTAAVFVLNRSGATAAALTVAVAVSEAGTVLDGTPPGSVRFAAGAAAARLTVATGDDTEAEADARVTATITDADGYRVATSSATAGVDVLDDEAADAATVALWSIELAAADARVREAAGAKLRFVVSLSEEAAEAVSVRYATADGTALAGEDYVAASGAVRFAAGETSRVVVVEVLEDAHGEGPQTLTLRLTRPFGAVLADSEATGTITNDDPLPGAWLARFGRTAATHVLAAVQERLSAAGQSQVTLGGQRLVAPDAAAVAAAREMHEREWAQRLQTGRLQDEPQPLHARELWAGSSFELAALTGPAGAAEGSDDDGRWSLWGRGAWSSFTAADGGLSLDGEVATGVVGADYERAALLAGLALAYSTGSGGFRDAASQDKGDLRAWLVGVHPYARLTLHERLSVWGLFGYGLAGELALDSERAAVSGAGLGLVMGAFGARGTLLEAAAGGGLELAAQADGLLLRMSTDATAELAATDVEVSRTRLLLQGSRPVRVLGGTLRPALEVGMRYDGGDAEHGAGLVLGGRVSYVLPRWGLSLEASGQSMLRLEHWTFSEWGAAGALRLDPGMRGRGAALSVAPSWGTAPSGGALQLWHLPDAGAIPAGAVPTAQARLAAELSYGLAFAGGSGLLTPYAGVAAAAPDSRTWRLGARARLPQGLGVSLEAAVTESPADASAAPRPALALTASHRW